MPKDFFSRALASSARFVSVTLPAQSDLSPWPDLDLAWLDSTEKHYTHGRSVTLTAENLSSINHSLQSTLASIEEHIHPDVSWVSPTRLYCGAAFDPARPHDTDPIWHDFPLATAFLPRESLIVSPHGTAHRVIFSKSSTKLSTNTPTLRAIASPRNPHDHWTKLVRNALTVFENQQALKLVAARRVDLSLDQPTSPLDVLNRLDASASVGTTRFLFSFNNTSFIGATPETLLKKASQKIFVDALAGTLPRHGNDTTARHVLSSGTKERLEHSRVVDFIRETLAPWCELTGPDEPCIKTLPSVYHLHTPLTGTLKNSVSVIDLAAALHPTPAVAGTPRNIALEWIRTQEPHSRGWYAGPVGWVDTHGDGHFIVALRSGVLRDRAAWAWAGAGLVQGSDPELEWLETQAKLTTFLQALPAYTETLTETLPETPTTRNDRR